MGVCGCVCVCVRGVGGGIPVFLPETLHSTAENMYLLITKSHRQTQKLIVVTGVLIIL